jgi:hypothetical protein
MSRLVQEKSEEETADESHRGTRGSASLQRTFALHLNGKM